ncbi:murein biosynthesis integral membrane protein MurJ [Protaetiibacter intestinalis]|nr:murein biosynthesis integral membrane protein MurJ [Protaetiibacter intestinalis]
MSDPAVDDGTIRRASTTIAAGTLVSRVLGFVNLAVLAWVLGQQNPGVNAFALANTIPSNLFALVAGGLTSAVLVPQIVRAARDADGGQAFVNKLLTLGVTACLAIAVLVTLAAPLLIPLYAVQGVGTVFDADAMALATAFAYWCLPQVFFYAVYALLGEALNARQVFGPYTWAPVLNNVILIGSLALFAALFGIDPAHQDPASWTPAQIALLGGGATLGIAAQCLVLTLFWRRTGLRFRPDFHWKGVGLRATGKAAGWMFGMIVVTQLTIVLQTRVASLAGPQDASVAVLNTAWLLFMLPHSILALSIATPYFTRMSAHASAGDVRSVRDDLSSSLRVIVMLVTGAGAAIGAAAIPFGAFFGRTPAEVVGISSVLIAYLIGLVPFSAMFVLQRGFFALGDTRTPFLIKVLQGVTVSLALLAVALLAPKPQVAVGVALATTIASTVQALVLALVLRHRIHGLDARRVLVRTALFFAAAVPAIGAGVGVLALLGGFSRGFAVANTGTAFVSVALVGATVLAVYFALLLLVRVPELQAGLTPLRRLLRRT